jgi:hypothetical protein
MWTWIASLSTVIFLVWGVVIASSLVGDVSELNDENSSLKQAIKQAKERLRTCDRNLMSICYAGAEYQGDIRYIDCGESFAERWATCLCTTMCLEDFTVTVTNKERCRNWPSVPIQIRPEPDEEEEEKEDEEEN